MKYFNRTNHLMPLKKTRFLIRSWILIGVLLIPGLQSVGQNDYHLFKFYEPFHPDSTGKFFLAMDNVNFFKNNEYKGELATGYTLTGTWIRPKIVYYPDAKLRMEFGGNVLKYNGRDEYYHLLPWFNVHYQPTEKISFILGNLNNEQNHHLPEFLADPEMFLTSKPEAGLQARYNTNRFTADLWIDWQQFIVKGDPFKERFAFGALANWKIFEKDNTSISVPLAFYGLHQGGEIDVAAGLAKSFISVTTGLSFKKSMLGRTFKGWGLNTNFSRSSYPKDSLLFKASSGWGIYVNGHIDTQFGGLTAAYWHGHLYYTPQGSALYQNLTSDGTQMLPDNHLLNLKYHYDHQIFGDTFFGFVFDYYYDTINMQTMNCAALYLIVNFGVTTKRTKTR